MLYDMPFFVCVWPQLNKGEMPVLLAPGRAYTFVSNHPSLTQIRMDALTHDCCLSVHKLETLRNEREAFFIVTNSHWLHRTEKVIKDAVFFCFERLDIIEQQVDRFMLLRTFNPRMIAKSYYKATYPVDFTSEEVETSRSFIGAYETLLRHSVQVEDLAAFEAGVCEAFLNALEAHTRVFGYDKELTLDEQKETALSDFAYMYGEGGDEALAKMEVSEPLFQTIPNTTIMFYFRPKYSLT